MDNLFSSDDSLPPEEKKDRQAAAILVHFASREDAEAFGALVGVRVTLETKEIFFPLEAATREEKTRTAEAAEPKTFAESVGAATISSRDWADLLNRGVQAGWTIDEINAVILEKFSVPPRRLRLSNLDEALALVSIGGAP